jgi:death-on-curing protein
MVGTLQVLTVKEIVEINRRMINEFGGIFFEGNKNLMRSGSLEYVLEEIQGGLFGVELHPTLPEKAAAICWRIIINHVFTDGNKRTGMEACRLFLEMNGYEMRIDADVVDMALRMANNQIVFRELVYWLEGRITKVSDSYP